MLGHELRNPLNAISGAGVILSSAPAANGVEEQAREVVVRQTRHLSRIVDDLLDLGRLMIGKVPLELETVDLADACRRTVAAMQHAGRLGADSVSIHAQPVCVQADRARFEQAVGILIASVMKPGVHDAKVELRITHDQRQANLYVRAVGPGIPEHLSAGETDAAATFEPSLDPNEGGPSIGLGIVERIVQMHGGRMEIRFARRGHGGEFIVRLPMPMGETHAAEATPPQSAPTQHDLRVLVVDDHDDSRAMLRLLLQQSGHETVEAVDGIEGVQLALVSRPDAAIVEIGLPGIDGYEVARRLRKLPNGADIALIALTGYGQVEDRERALRAGFDEHLVKPLDAQRLEAALMQTARPPQERPGGGDQSPR
jgi:CheY-like chemotaxis protein